MFLKISADYLMKEFCVTQPVFFKLVNLTVKQANLKNSHVFWQMVLLPLSHNKKISPNLDLVFTS